MHACFTLISQSRASESMLESFKDFFLGRQPVVHFMSRREPSLFRPIIGEFIDCFFDTSGIGYLRIAKTQHEGIIVGIHMVFTRMRLS